MAGDSTHLGSGVPPGPSNLATRLSSFKYKEFEARFDEELRQVKQVAGAVRTGKIEAPKSSPEPTEYEELLRIAEVSPRAAIAEAWRRVELAATEAARVAHIDAPPSPSQQFAELIEPLRVVVPNVPKIP